MALLDQLNPVQRQAASVIQGPVMIVAGAGSGKTRVLTYRIAQLLHSGIPPYEILALTFTNKAAKEMKERIERLIGNQAHNVWAGTFHSIFARILRQEAEALGYSRSFTIYDSDDSQNVIKNIMTSLSISQQQVNPRGVQSRISGAKNQMMTPREYEEIAKDFIDQKVAQVFTEYQPKLHKSNAMDFDDLLLKPIELFKKFPNTLEKYQYRFKYILVDEYQDTNRAQYVLINMLAQRFKNIAVVGDDAQSIYAFRGADIRNILDFERDYPNAQVFRLEQNYRSTKTILAAADSVIKNNRNQITKTLWTDNPKGEKISVIESDDDKAEGLAIAQKIQEHISKEKLNLKDFAILYRTNAQSRSIEDALRRSGIPYVIVGGVEFYKRKEIKDVLAYLRLIVNPKDEESLLRVINYPPRGIGDTTIDKLIEHATKTNASLFDIIVNARSLPTIADRTKNSINQFGALIKKYSEMKSSMSASEVARSVVDELGILRMYKEEQTPESLGRWENIQELLSAISEFVDQNKDKATLESFLEEVALVSAVDQMVDERNSVTMMTLHSAKGLEFPVVFIGGMEEGLFPLYQITPDSSELEEERRLCYVGITRAMKKLYLTYTRIRYRFGDVTYPVVSRFLSEINESLLEKEASRKSAVTVTTISNLSSVRQRYVESLKQKQERKHEEFAPDAEIDYENQTQEEIRLKVGVYVEHEVFGKGKVTQLSGKGDSAKAVVQFNNVGPKNLMIKFARLKVLGVS
ncbi:MAG: UvrD-helicase domain-containing protein [Ignavibacteriales bacterium]|nr:UvrD-helicase domain-containing protein [Ignavibacteriales bacterium]